MSDQATALAGWNPAAATLLPGNCGSDGPELTSLLRLMTSQLHCSMAIISQYTASSANPAVIAALGMTGQLAAGLAAKDLNTGFAGIQALTRTGYSVRCGWEEPATGSFIHTLSRLNLSFLVDSAHAISISVFRPRHSPFTASDSSAMNALGEEAVAHMQLWWQLQQQNQRADILSAILDLSDIGTLLLDPGGGILLLNEQAKALLATGDGLRQAGQTVMASDLEDSIRLQTAIRHVSGGGGTAKGQSRIPVFLLRRGNRARPLVAAVLSITELDGGGAGTTVLYVLDPDRDTRNLVSAACQVYGMTATEGELTGHMVNGHSIAEAAELLHIQTQTARAYLKQIFAKTGTHRQADLVRLILNSLVRARRPAGLSII